MTTTIRDVALAAGVSQATAARALNGYGSVSARALQRVSEAADELGYRPNRVAQALRLGHARTVGFIPGDLEIPFFATVTRYLADAMEASGYTLLVSSSGECVDRERKIIETMRSHQVSSFVIAPAPAKNAEHLSVLLTSEIPLVLIDRTSPHLQADTVTVDNREGARQVVAHLHGLGHRRIAMLSDDLQIDSSRDRVQGFSEAAQDLGYDPRDAEVYLTTGSRTGAYDGARRILDSSKRVTGIFAGESLMTLGLLRAAADTGLRIPEDISLVGFDDFELAQSMRPTITTVAQPIANVGTAAAELLLRRLNDFATPIRQVLLPTELLVRQSSGPPSREHH